MMSSPASGGIGHVRVLHGSRDVTTSTPPASSSGGGGPPDDLSLRVAGLERTLASISGKLDDVAALIADGRIESERRFGSVEIRLTGLEKVLEAKASTADLRELTGKVSSIPSTWQTLAIMAGLLVGVGGLAFTIAKLSGH